MKRILVGMDGSDGARVALAWAQATAESIDAEVVVAASTPDAPDGISGPYIQLQGDPRLALVEAGIEQEADAVVAGSSGVPWFPARHTDHVAHHLACHARQPVVIVPRQTPPAPTRGVVLALDGSPGSMAALAWLRDAGLPAGTPVIAVHAVLPEVPERVRTGRVEPPVDDALLAQWVAPLRPAYTVEVRRTTGDPVETLGAVASETGPTTLIVIGGRPVDDRHPYCVGSVGLRLLDRAHHPVLIVPPAG